MEPFDLDGPVLAQPRAFELVPASAGGWAAVSVALARLLAAASTEGLWWATIDQPEGANPGFAHLGPDEDGSLYTEVAGDFYLPQDAHLDPGQWAALRRLGWADPVPDLSGDDEIQPRNHTRSWPVDELVDACDHVLMTLQCVYGFAETDTIGVYLDPFAPPDAVASDVLTDASGSAPDGTELDLDDEVEDEDEEYDADGEYVGDLPAGYLDDAEELASMSIENGLSARCLYLNGVVLDQGSIDGETDPWRDVYEDADRAHAAVTFVQNTWSGSAGVPLCPLDDALGMPPMTIDLAEDLWEQVGAEVLGVVWGPCHEHSGSSSAEFATQAEVYLSGRPWHWRRDKWTPVTSGVTLSGEAAERFTFPAGGIIDCGMGDGEEESGPGDRARLLEEKIETVELEELRRLQEED